MTEDTMRGVLADAPALSPLRRHYGRSVSVAASPEDVFDFIDDHARFAAHMAKSSWMMAGHGMVVDLDAGKGKAVGSHIRMHGSVAGLELALDEVVTARERPFRKEWETVGTPRLILLAPEGHGARVSVRLDYRRPSGRVQKLLSRIFGGIYARWCVDQMLNGVTAHFAKR
jgi:hypothetical protein